MDGLWVDVYGRYFSSSLCLAQRNAQNEIHLKNLKPARKMEYYVNRALVFNNRHVLSANFVQTFTDGIIVGLIKYRWCTISRRWSCFTAVCIIIDFFWMVVILAIVRLLVLYETILINTALFKSVWVLFTEINTIRNYKDYNFSLFKMKCESWVWRGKTCF